MEERPKNEDLTDHTAAINSVGAGAGTVAHGSSGDGLLLGRLAHIDAALRQRGDAWHELAKHLGGLRREIEVTNAQVQTGRSIATRKRSRLGKAVQEPSPMEDPVEDRSVGLIQHFEAALRETEERRLALHGEMLDLRRRRLSLLGALPIPLSHSYQSLIDRGRLPAIALVDKGACGGCESQLPQSLIEELGRGEVPACIRCGRLLCSSGSGA